MGAVNSDNDYGNNGMAIFLNTAQKEGICVEYSVKFYRTEHEKLKKVVDTIKKGTAKVIVAFISFLEMSLLTEQLSVQNITGLQMVGVEAWITSKSLITPTTVHVLGGSLGFAMRKINIEGFADYVIKTFWDTAFPCSQGEGNDSQIKVNCSRYQYLLVLKITMKMYLSTDFQAMSTKQFMLWLIQFTVYSNADNKKVVRKA